MLTGMGKFKRLFEKSIIRKSRQEFKNILSLENKRLAMEKEYGEELPTEVVSTQKEILKNNLLALAKVIDSEGGFENSLDKMDKGYYFNIQGTKPQIIECPLNEYYLDPYSSKVYYESNNIKETSTICQRLDTGMTASLTRDLISLEEKFLSLKSPNIKTKVKNKIIYLAEQKIKNKIIEFSNIFKGNEQLVRDYIFSGLEGEVGHWHNYREFRYRLNFIGLLYYKLEERAFREDDDLYYASKPDLSVFPTDDSEDFGITVKELMFIHSPKNIKLKDFLSNFKNRRFDFILQERNASNLTKGGNSG